MQIPIIQLNWNLWHVLLLHKYVDRLSSAEWVESRFRKNSWKTWFFHNFYNISPFNEFLFNGFSIQESFWIMNQLGSEEFTVFTVNYPALTRLIFPLSTTFFKVNFNFHSECFDWINQTILNSLVSDHLRKSFSAELLVILLFSLHFSSFK